MRPTTLDPTKTGDEAESLEAGLRQRIIGQEDAIRQVVETYQTYVSGMASPGRPIANLMFLGPTGSGKTRLVEATAECLLGNPRAVIKIDCGEFQHSVSLTAVSGIDTAGRRLLTEIYSAGGVLVGTGLFARGLNRRNNRRRFMTSEAGRGW